MQLVLHGFLSLIVSGLEALLVLRSEGCSEVIGLLLAQ